MNLKNASLTYRSSLRNQSTVGFRCSDLWLSVVATVAHPHAALHVHVEETGWMTNDEIIAMLESEWEPETGFFWNIRQGLFRSEEFDRALKKVQTLGNYSD